MSVLPDVVLTRVHEMIGAGIPVKLSYYRKNFTGKPVIAVQALYMHSPSTYFQLRRTDAAPNNCRLEHNDVVYVISTYELMTHFTTIGEDHAERIARNDHTEIEETIHFGTEANSDLWMSSRFADCVEYGEWLDRINTKDLHDVALSRVSLTRIEHFYLDNLKQLLAELKHLGDHLTKDKIDVYCNMQHMALTVALRSRLLRSQMSPIGELDTALLQFPPFLTAEIRGHLEQLDPERSDDFSVKLNEHLNRIVAAGVLGQSRNGAGRGEEFEEATLEKIINSVPPEVLDV